MRAWLTREPWNDEYELRLAVSAGQRALVATGVDEQGRIIWSEEDQLAQIKPVLRLREDVVEALGRALGDITQASDQTVAALNDSQQVRDRLLTLVETVVNRGGTTD